MECSLSLTCTREIIDPINRIQKHIFFDFFFIIFQSTTMCLPSFHVNYILYLWLLPLTWWCLYPSGPNFWSPHKVISITQTHREYIFSFYYVYILYMYIYNLDCVAKYYWNLSPTPFSLLPLFFSIFWIRLHMPSSSCLSFLSTLTVSKCSHSLPSHL